MASKTSPNNIRSLSQSWKYDDASRLPFSGDAVEAFIKSQLSTLFSDKYGHVERDGSDLKFYDEDGGTLLKTISLAGDVYTITINANLNQAFYILADETTKMLSITPSTTVAAFGSDSSDPYPEAYTYTVAINNGNGYVPRISGDISSGDTATFDIRPYLATGDNYIRVSVVGQSSGQAKTTVFTGTLTTLTMSCSHTWQNAWLCGESYTINGIRFAGSLQKTLHVSVNDVELPTVEYTANQSFTTTSTTYTIPVSAFPTLANSDTCEVKLWMTGSGVSTRVITYNIMCIAEDDATPVIAINNLASAAVNYTSDRLFSYAVYNADSAEFDLSAVLGGSTYSINGESITLSNLVAGTKYDFSYSLEVDTGINELTSGTFYVSGTAFNGSTEGTTLEVSMPFDNTYSYIATPGALFYMNAATRSNSTEDYEEIINEMGASSDNNFDASYEATWSGMTWYTDGWGTDDTPEKNKALHIPAGASVSVTDFAPLGKLASYPNGLTVEMLLKCSYPSDYSQPILTMTSDDPVNGLLIYPTKVTVYGSTERSTTLQTVNIDENEIIHLTVTFTKNYGGVNSRNLVSVYVNGISNVNFAFGGSSNFGFGNLVIGNQNADVYLYKMRVYGSALEPQAVFSNFLNCVLETSMGINRRVLDAKNDILDGGAIGYEAVKAAGYNTMVVIMDENSHPIPSFENQASYDGCTLKFEYADDSNKNVTVGNISLDGQGTTSKKYFRWNLRAKTNDETTWEYGDGTSETGKEGYFAGTDYARVDRITAKKNYASSMQGHKMGLTGLYNDLFVECGLAEHLPNEDYRVAVYQFPFVGFKYNSTNDTYEFIGIYTAGPDKGSKCTFGYLKSYSSLLSLEGPNHAPRGTRFLHPWVDVDYDYQNETLTFGGQEGWDCDFVGGGLKTDAAASAASVLALYNSEWRPAYELVYNCSPYIASAAEVISGLNNNAITSISDLTNASNAKTILEGSTNGISNQLISFYDTSYELYFYRTSTEKFEKLSDVDSTREHNVVTYLLANNYLSTSTPTTTQIIAARGARFKAEAPNYWDIDQTLFHYDFCVLLGITDNFAKNSYPFKFNALSGTTNNEYNARWGWRQDDLDTALMTDNNGQNTKSYSVEHGDTASGVEIFQGGDSALWVLIRDNYATEIRTMFGSIANAASDLAVSYRVQGDGLHNSLFNLISYYCWDHSAKYFAATMYEDDRKWSYIEPWLKNASQSYNGVLPLTQALGDQYLAEKLWMQRRIAYVFSKYRIGAFTGDTTGYNTIAFTLAEPFTFNIKPAIDLYPVVTLANSQDVQGSRTTAGNTTAITMVADGQTTNYIKGGDWLASLGDLSGMKLTSRGTGEDVAFSVTTDRIQELKVGDADPNNVDFNATSLNVTSPSITTIDARNTTTVTNEVDLSDCPRLTTVLFEGSGATGLTLPVGSKVSQVSFPAASRTLFLHSLPYLQSGNLTLPTLSNVRNLYIKNCDQLNPIDLLKTIVSDNNNQLEYASLSWNDVKDINTSYIEPLSKLADLSGNLSYNEDTGLSTVNGKPALNGTLSLTDTVTTTQLESIGVDVSVVGTSTIDVQSTLSDDDFKVRLSGENVGIVFEDPNVESICLTNWDVNGDNKLSLSEALAVNTIGTVFKDDSTIVSFDEFKYFTGVTSLGNGQITGCSSLTSITLPKSIKSLPQVSVFQNNSALVRISGWEDFDTVTHYMFQNCTNVSEIHASSLSKYLNINYRSDTSTPFYYSTAITRGLYINNKLVTDVDIPYGTSVINGYVFYKNNTINSLTIPSSVTIVNSYAFWSSSLKTVNISPSSNLTDLGRSAFQNCVDLTTINLPSSITSVGALSFAGCTALTDIGTDWMSNVTYIGGSAFSGSTNLVIDDLNLPSFPANGFNSEAYQFTEVKIKKVSNLGLTDKITAYCFRNCTTLEEITIPSSVTSCVNSAFLGCSGLTKVNISDLSAYLGITFTNALASPFYDSTALTRGLYLNGELVENLVIPNNISTINAYAFANNNTLKSISAPSITSIGIGAFNMCINLIKFEFPNLVTIPYNSSNIFGNIPVIEEISLQGLQTIADSAYIINTAATVMLLDIGPNITSIGTLLFGTSVTIQTFVCRATTPPTFTKFYIKPEKIYVPYSSDHSVLNSYKAATNWIDWEDIIYELNDDGTIPD